jgi:hypothetical protein
VLPVVTRRPGDRRAAEPTPGAPEPEPKV